MAILVVDDDPVRRQLLESLLHKLGYETGESGVGKELIARAIHASGERHTKPFVAVNCGAMPENLIESILFGHEKGSLTGATGHPAGKFVEASGGTLLQTGPVAAVRQPTENCLGRPQIGRRLGDMLARVG